jgi:NTE family protein
MSFGIAFSGGGTRGAAHVGVLCALAEAGIFPRAVAGTSAGSIVAGLYGLGLSIDELKALVNDLTVYGSELIDADYIGLIKAVGQFICRKPVTFSGLIKGNRLENYLYYQTDGKRIDQVKIRTVIPAVDLESGETFAYTNELSNVKPLENVSWQTGVGLSFAMRASCAVPAVFQPKTTNQSCLVDGGVTDLLPVNLLIAAGEENVLAVDLSGAYHGTECDHIMEIASHSLSVMSRRLSEYASVGEKLLLKPSLPKNAELLTFSEMKSCMNAGYDATVALLPQIKEIFDLAD